jgi:sodium/potassium-transporting ATPase subunit alpha
METKSLTTLQRELLRFVGIIAGLATTVAVIIVILWAAWYVYNRIVYSSPSDDL